MKLFEDRIHRSGPEVVGEVSAGPSVLSLVFGAYQPRLYAEKQENR
jgi:hypothetical protein